MIGVPLRTPDYTAQHLSVTKSSQENTCERDPMLIF